MKKIDLKIKTAKKKTEMKKRNWNFCGYLFDSHKKIGGSASSIYWIYEKLMLNTHEHIYNSLEKKIWMCSVLTAGKNGMACYQRMCSVCQQLEIYLSNNIVNIHNELFHGFGFRCLYTIDHWPLESISTSCFFLLLYMYHFGCCYAI